MRSISPALLAAATSRRGRPVVTLAVEDRRSRWVRHAAGTASARRSALCTSSRGLVRAILRGGALQVAIVADPADPAAWPGAWVNVANDADGVEDVALAAWTSLALSIFYRNSSGALARVDSADGGLTWSVPAACRLWETSPVRLAADGGACAFSRPGEIRLAITRDDAGGPAWSAETLYTGLPGEASCQGLALARDPASAVRYLLAIAADGGLAVTWWDAASHAFGPTDWLTLPGSTAAATSSHWRDPALAATPDGVYLSAVDRLGPGDTAHWEQTAIFRTGAWPALERVATLDMGQASGARAALAARGGAVYAAQENNVCRSVTWQAGLASHNLAGLLVSAYRLRADDRGSRLELTVPNIGEALARPGAAGGALEPLAPGATVVLRRGYRTAAGDETVALPPHIVTGVHLTAGAGGGELRVAAEDGLALLARTHPPDLWDRTDRPIRALLAALAGALGLGYADAGEAALGRAIARCTLSPGQTLAEGVHALLEMAGAVAACDASGALRARVLVAWSPAPAAVGAGGEILRAAYGREMPAETGWRVWGDGLAAASNPGEDAMELGVSLLRGAVDHRATTADLAGAIAAFRALRAALAARTDRVTVPLRPDLELWDRVAVSAPPYVEAGDPVRRVTGVEEEYAARRGLYETTLLAAWGE